jgi:hypothetical protein
VASIERLAPRSKTLNLAPMKTLVIDAGRQDKLRPGDILGALTGDAGLKARRHRQDRCFRHPRLRGDQPIGWQTRRWNVCAQARSKDAIFACVH